MKKILIIMAGIVGLCLFSCETDSWDGYFFITYEVTGTAQSVDITMLNEGGNFTQLSDVYLPWETSFRAYCGTGEGSYLIVSIGATSNSESGSVTVSIYYKKYEDEDYELLNSNTSEGAYVTAHVTDNISP